MDVEMHGNEPTFECGKNLAGLKIYLIHELLVRTMVLKVCRFEDLGIASRTLGACSWPTCKHDDFVVHVCENVCQIFTIDVLWLIR